jgi:hypothetical protein
MKKMKIALAEELFNLRHALARNVIEHIFGVLKQHFKILLLPPAYNMDIQGRLPAALCALCKGNYQEP